MYFEDLNLYEKLMHIVYQERQLYWWLGHVCCACHGLFYFSSVLSLNTNIVYYKRAYLGVLLSYAVVIYNSVGVSIQLSETLNCHFNHFDV